MELGQGQIKFDRDDESSESINENDGSTGGALAKIGLLVFIFLAVSSATYMAVSRATYAQKLEQVRNQQLLFSAPLQITDWRDLGRVSEPTLELFLKTKENYKRVSFLLDSGAVVSSLPREMAGEMGQNLALLKRTVFSGFGNQTSFAYHSDMNLKIGETDVTLPVVFTESENTQPLLGRKGFFDNYSITFNHVLQTVEIRQ